MEQCNEGCFRQWYSGWKKDSDCQCVISGCPNCKKACPYWIRACHNGYCSKCAIDLHSKGLLL